MAVNFAPPPVQNPQAMALALLAQQQSGGSASDAEMALQKMMLAKQAESIGDSSPVQHWTQGLARMANAGIAGYRFNQLLAQAKANEASTANTLSSLPGLGGASPAPAPQPSSPGPMGALQGMGKSIAEALAGGGSPAPIGGPSAMPTLPMEGDSAPAMPPVSSAPPMRNTPEMNGIVPAPPPQMAQGAEPVVPSQMPMPPERPQQTAALDPGTQALVQALMQKPEPQATQPGMAEVPRPPADVPGQVPLPPKHPGLQGPIRDYANSIAKIESGGRYDLKGPVTSKGDQALGKYQVMGNNLPQWSQAAFGRPVSKQEFLSNPKIQDQLFENRFGGYVDKYGPEGASKAWFAGEGGMKNPQARDQLGTSVASYADRFSRGLGQSDPQRVQMASLGNGVPMPQGAPQAQGAPPQQMAQAQPQQAPASRQTVQIPPEMAAQIKSLIANPKTRQYGLQLYQQYAKPTDRYEPVMGKNNQPYGQRSTLTGEVKPMPRESEYTIQKTETGEFIAVNKNDPTDQRIIQPPGGREGVIKFKGDEAAAAARGKVEGERAATAGERRQQELRGADFVSQDIQRTIDKVRGESAFSPATGITGSAAAMIPATRGHDVSKLLDGIKANISFDRLQQMRQASPTGGALGNVTEKELTYLQSVLGSVEQSQSQEQMLHNLERLHQTYQTIIHGPEHGALQNSAPKLEEKSIGGKTYFKQNGQWFEK